MDTPFSYDVVIAAGLPVEQMREAVIRLNGRHVGNIPRGETQLAEEVWAYPDGDRTRIIDAHFVAVMTLRAESARPGQPA